MAIDVMAPLWAMKSRRPALSPPPVHAGTAEDDVEARLLAALSRYDDFVRRLSEAAPANRIEGTTIAKPAKADSAFRGQPQLELAS
ncbi:hypothetical protein [Rhizorhabdus dicambivorans]|uniref:hypothetical protein n=1 Tax=Rhizorhabdus dicambivorans TaxID=1850238 RepID=UPI0011119416|nr:hypothetical protein [Rhizorhabdus dicambivorans]